MMIKTIHPLSAAKILSAMYALVGLLVGAVTAILALTGHDVQMPNGTALGRGLAIASVFLFPIMYSLVGFITGLLFSFLFNLVTSIVGPLEIESE